MLINTPFVHTAISPFRLITASRGDSLVQDCLVGLDGIIDPFIHRFQTAISDDHCNFDNLVLESVQTRHFTIDLGFSRGSPSTEVSSLASDLEESLPRPRDRHRIPVLLP